MSETKVEEHLDPTVPVIDLTETVISNLHLHPVIHSKQENLEKFQLHKQIVTPKYPS